MNPSSPGLAHHNASILPIQATLFAASYLAFTLAGFSQTILPMQPQVRWGGRAVAVTVDPENPRTAIVASESGGLFKTFDDGRTWYHVETLPIFRLVDVKYAVASPPGQKIVLATGWSDARTTNSSGIWRSTDGGTTWARPTTSAPSPDSRGASFGIATAGLGEVYVGTDFGLAISRDYGATWRFVVPDPTNRRVTSVAAQTGGIVDILGNAGHQRSIDRGDTFGSISPFALTAQHALEVLPGDRNVIFVAAPTMLPMGCQRKATVLWEGDFAQDGTVTWTQVFLPRCLDCCGGAGALGRDPWVAVNRSRVRGVNLFDVYFGDGLDVWRQTCANSGGTAPRCSSALAAWTSVNVDHPDANGMAFSLADRCPKYIVSDGGVHVPVPTVDPEACGISWRVTGSGRDGFNALQIYDLAGQLGAYGNTDLYIGTQDNDLWASRDFGATWPAVKGGEGFHIQVPRYAGGPATRKVTLVNVGVSPADRVSEPYFVGDRAWTGPPGSNASNPTLIAPGVYMQFSQSNGTINRLHLTTDYGATWTRTAAEIPQQLYDFPSVSREGNAVTIYQAVSPRFGAVRLVKITGILADGSTGAVRVSEATPFFFNIATYCMGEGTFSCPAVFGVDPNDPRNIIIADLGSGRPGMYASTNGGADWDFLPELTDLITGYDPVSGTQEFRFTVYWTEYPWLSGVGWQVSPGASVQPHVVGFDPFRRGHILVGTESAGIFRSTNRGRTWQGIPGSRQVSGITSFFFRENNYSDPNNNVVISTYGRGLWRLRIPPGNGYPWDLQALELGALGSDWLRHPDSGDLLTREQFLCQIDPECSPIARWTSIVGGKVRDIVIDPQSKQIASLAIDGGRMISSSTDGDVIGLNVPLGKQDQYGAFEGCPGCKTLIASGAEIRGVVIENGQLVALMAGFGPLPGEAQMDAFDAPLPEPPPTSDLQPLAGPSLQLLGSISGSQPAAWPGSTITLAGSGFCGDPQCSPIALSVGGEVIAQGVPVDTKGNFEKVVATVPQIGLQVITARQTGAQGELLEASLSILQPVGGGDEAEAEDPEPPELVSAGSLDGVVVGLCFDKIVTKASGEVIQNYSVNNGTVQVLGAVLRPDGKSVQLALANPLSPGPFTVKALNIEDWRGNAGESAIAGTFASELAITDVGGTTPGEAFWCASDSFEITSSGTAMFLSTEDQFRLVSRPVTGDFDVHATLVPGAVAYRSFAGLVARESRDKAGARSFGAVFRWEPRDVITILRRDGGAVSETLGVLSPKDTPPLPLSLRLKRAGHAFTAFVSANNLDWVALAQADTSAAPFQNELSVGFMAGAGESNQTATVEWRDLSFQEPLPANPPALTCPGSLVISACSTGVVVNYPISAAPYCGTNLNVTCEPPEGSVLLPGEYLVRCYALDDCQQVAACAFPVTVLPLQGCSPSLAIRREGDNVVISWPASFIEHHLQSTTHPEDPKSWTRWPDPVVVVGDRNTVTVPQPLWPWSFFRLIRP